MEYKAEDGTILTNEKLDQMAREYESGTWHGHGEVAKGRPKLYDEDMETASFRLPKSRIKAVTARMGTSKSDFFRDAIDNALLESA